MLQLGQILVDDGDPLGASREAETVPRRRIPVPDGAKLAAVIVTRQVFKHCRIVDERVDLPESDTH